MSWTGKIIGAALGALAGGPVGAALGTFVGHSVSWFHRERARRSLDRKRLGLAPKRETVRHSFHVTTRSLRWSVQF